MGQRTEQRQPERIQRLMKEKLLSLAVYCKAISGNWDCTGAAVYILRSVERYREVASGKSTADL